MQLWVGLLLIYQPFYIGGIEDVGRAKVSAFGAMVTFIATFVISIILGCRDSRVKRRQLLLARAQHAYDQVPTSSVETYEINLGDLPTSVVEQATAGRLSRRSSGLMAADDELVTEEELSSSQPHVPEGQLLPTTHV